MTHLGFPSHALPDAVRTSSPLSPLDAAPHALLLVLEPEPMLADMLAELASFLRVDIETVPTIGALQTALETLSPIGLLARVPESDNTAWSALRTLSANNPGLPVLLVTGDGAEQADPLDRRQPMTNVFWLDQRPSLRSMVDFLFLAERRGGGREVVEG